MMISVRFETTVMDDATEQEIEEWLYFELKAGSIKVSNPLANKELSLVDNLYWRKI